MGIRTVSLVHELPRILREKGLEDVARMAIGRADRVVFASDFVRDRLVRSSRTGRGDERFLIRATGQLQANRAGADGGRNPP